MAKDKGIVLGFPNEIRSNAGTGTIITPYKQDAVMKKQAYSLRQVFTVANNAVKELIIDPTTLPHDTILEPFRVGVSAGTVVMEIIIDITTSDDGDALPAVNRYGLVDIPAHVFGIYENPSGVDEGSNPPLKYSLGSNSTNQNSGGGTNIGSNIFVMETDKKNLIKFTNNSGESVDISLQLDWFEV